MIPLVHPIFGQNEKKILSEILESRMIASGKYVDKFENTCAGMFGTKHAIAVSNGTTALHTALFACGIKPGDKVLTTPFSFIATANSILHVGAKPVFADIDPKTFNLSPIEAEKILKKEKDIKAVIIVHLYGLPCDMDAFIKLKKKYKFILIEDCAQAHGAKFRNKSVGSFGDASAFSFYATKNITTGEGGIILTNNPKVDVLARQFINHGRDGHSNHAILGYNFRLTNLAAGIGLEQLKNLESWSEARRENAAYLSKHLSDIKHIKTPLAVKNIMPVFHQYTIRVRKDLRESLIDYLKARGIGYGVYYPYVIYQQPFYQKLGYKMGTCPEAEKAAKEVLSLPVHPALKRNELDAIINAVREYFLKIGS
jgi:perosamine synthetase